ncbi:MAG: 50S ribosomal protein L22 [Chloroflexi bacterium]|nr:50S ribosomal protein L22 [Chloroflexota bacterium]
MAVKAVAKNVTASPRKVRRVLKTVRGQKVEAALQILSFLSTPIAREVAKVVKSAASNAENNHMMAQGDLKIVAIHADAGATLRRTRARSRGRASRILKRSSHVTVLVDEEEEAS